MAERMPAEVPKQLKEELNIRAKQFSAAQDARSQSWVQSLVDVADNKAKKLESDAKHKRMADLRAAIGATGDRDRCKKPYEAGLPMAPGHLRME